MRPRTLTPSQRSLPDLFPLHRTALAAQAQTPSADATHKLTDGGDNSEVTADILRLSLSALAVPRKFTL